MGFFFLRAAPGTTYGGIPNLGLSWLLHPVERRTRLTVSVVLTADCLFWLEGPLSVRLLDPPHILPHVRNALYFR